MLILPQITFGSQAQNLVTTLYTGDNSNRSIVTGQNLANGSLVWIKNRSSSSWSHVLFDTERGATNYLLSNGSDPQATAAGSLTSFNSNGFGLGTANTANLTGDNYVAWSFLQKAGFMDIVDYTGNTSGGGDQTIAHNLGATVGMMIIKSTTDNVPWTVYHKDLNGGVNPEDYYLQLNDTAAQASSTEVFHSAAPTSTEFYVGSTTLTNQLGYGYIAYLFAHNPSQKIFCGSFTTDGSGNATVTGLGFRPKWLVVKSTSDTGQWIVWDTARGWSSGSDPYLLLNQSNAEATDSSCQPDSDGFTITQAINTDFIFIAIG